MPAFFVSLLVCLLPFSITLLVIPGTGLSILGIAVVLALISTGTAAIRRNERFDPLDWAALAWCTAWFASALAVPAHHDAALAAGARIAAGGILFVFIRSALEERDLTRTGLLFARIGAVAAALAIVTAWFPWFPAEISATDAGAPGFLLVIALPLALVNSDKARGRGSSRLRPALPLILAMGILFLGNRGAWLGAGAAGLVTLAVGAGHSRRTGAVRIAMALTVLTAVSFFVSPSLRQRVLDRPYVSRIDCIRMEWRAFRTRPFLGAGTGRLAANPSGSLYSRILAEGGVPAAAALAAIAGLATFPRRMKRGATARGLVAGCLVFGIFAPVLSSTGAGIAFWTALALCAPRTPSPAPSAR